ncbi:translation initiation factor IF-2-like [Accipiter gentilis]|uniref:translation initiation factor IF-2-like n=1 Tax=Astur gentilis TaxID=8957 RepID=UPI002110D351|nr:translation initiation factor IF-2-like [Accipiter gentilis]
MKCQDRPSLRQAGPLPNRSKKKEENYAGSRDLRKPLLALSARGDGKTVLFTGLPSSGNSWDRGGIPPLPPPAPSGLASAAGRRRGWASGRPRSRPPAAPPGLAPRRPRPAGAAPLPSAAAEGSLCPATPRRGEPQQRGLKRRERPGSLPRAPRKSRPQVHTHRQLRRIGAIRTNARVSEGHGGTVSVSPRSLSPPPPRETASWEAAGAFTPGEHRPSRRSPRKKIRTTSVACSITQDVALGVNPATLPGPRRFPVSRNFIPAAGPLRAPPAAAPLGRGAAPCCFGPLRTA